MKVFVVSRCVDYEGSDILKIFGDKLEAEKYVDEIVQTRSQLRYSDKIGSYVEYEEKLRELMGLFTTFDSLEIKAFDVN